MILKITIFKHSFTLSTPGELESVKGTGSTRKSLEALCKKSRSYTSVENRCYAG